MNVRHAENRMNHLLPRVLAVGCVAAPLAGGLFTSFALELLVCPAIYAIWKWQFGMKRGSVDVTQLEVPVVRGHG